MLDTLRCNARLWLRDTGDDPVSRLGLYCRTLCACDPAAALEVRIRNSEDLH